MSDNDLIRRGDALAVVANGKTTWGEAVTAIAALPAVTVGVKDFDVEVVRGNTGGNLALYFNDHRVAGSKPWGGGTTIHKFRVQGDDAKSAGILATIRNFQTVPPVKECLTTDTALPAVTVGVKPLVWEPMYDNAGMLQRVTSAWCGLFERRFYAERPKDQPRVEAKRAARILAALEPVTPAPHVNETPKTEHDAGNVLTPAPDAAAIREAALREALDAMRDAILTLITEKPHDRA